LIGKRVQFDDETWAAIEAVAGESGRSFQDVADEAFADFLKKHKQPVGLKAALRESVRGKPTASRRRKT
jgi:predicted transcriptional regulator